MKTSTLRPFIVGVMATVAATACGDTKEDTPPPQIDPRIFAEDGLGSIRVDATDEQRQTFTRGEEVALKRFTPEEGLGPRFNVTFCSSCHEKPVFGGSGPRYRDFYIFGQSLGDGAFLGGPLGGIGHAYGLDELRPAPFEGSNMAALRNAVPFFGVGAIAAIDEQAILANADPDDADGDGISGRPNYDRGFVGRFGRKSQTVSIEGFIRGPLNNHLGITTDPLTNEQQAALPIPSQSQTRNVTGGLQVAEQAQAAAPASPLNDNDDVPDPELSTEGLFDLVSWAMLLGAPKPDEPTEQTLRGEETFAQIGCASCHVPTLKGNKGLVPLYSDLLLHDMGEDMADGLPMGLATGSEFRTQPLWGLTAPGPYLHDGRADTIDEAIKVHGGEGQNAKEAYEALSDDERTDLLAFLDSLGGKDQKTEGLLPPNAPIPQPGEAGAPSRSLSAEEEALWLEGRRLFDRDMMLSEGLGPFFNGDSCRACHFEPALGGAGPLGVNVVHHGTFEGDQFTVPSSGRTILPKLSAQGLPREEYNEGHNTFESRQTPSAFGLGLIESIPEETILANADPDDEDGDGIRGVARVLPDGRLGRFGWKAQVPSVQEFVRDAMSNELGATLPVEEGQTFGFLTDDDNVPDPEMSIDQLVAVTFFLSHIAGPEPTAGDAEGAQIFESIGCASCHVPSMQGADGPVNLYSDLLLHDVAPESATGVPDDQASNRQFRTPPLWGISQTGPYMHDGLATTLEDAILAHDTEALTSRQNFLALSEDEQAALLRFLSGL